MGSYHYASTSQIIFAAVDSNPKPAYKPKATEQIPIMSPPEEGAREEGRRLTRPRFPSFHRHPVRRHGTAVRAANAEATWLERLLRRQETVDAVRSDERERARFSEVPRAAAPRRRAGALPGRAACAARREPPHRRHPAGGARRRGRGGQVADVRGIGVLLEPLAECGGSAEADSATG